MVQKLLKQQIAMCKSQRIPQGSVLGGLLFLTYINDLPAVSNKLFNVLFADDTCLAHAHHDFTKLIDEFNTELEKISHWLISNRLSLNTLKTVAIDFSNRKHEERSIILNGVTLDYSDYVKYLGVYLDKNLSFQKHINTVCGKMSKSIGIMHRISFFCPKLVLLKIYYSLIYPYLIYCNVVWGGACITHVNRVLVLQKRAVRIVHGVAYLVHTNDLFINSDLLKIYEIHRYSCCISAFKNMKQYIRPLDGLLITRNCRNHHVEFQRLTMSQRCTTYSVPAFFNALPTCIKSKHCLSSFKRTLKNYLTNIYRSWGYNV